VFAAAVVDGIDEVNLTFVDGSIQRVPVRDNMAYAPLEREPVDMRWSDPGGKPRSAPVQGGLTMQPPGVSGAIAGCHPLDPLPADAQQRARDVALHAVPRLYPDVHDPRVVDVRPAGADAGGCGPQTASRALLVSLEFQPDGKGASRAQGRLVLGSVNGRMAILQQLH
jgi:hypothetical protein